MCNVDDSPRRMNEDLIFIDPFDKMSSSLPTDYVKNMYI